MQQAVTGLLALMLVATSGVAGGLLHLCGMADLVRRTCCCDDAHEGPPVQLKRIDDCCGAAIAKGELPRVAAGSEKGCVDAPMLAVSVASTDELRGQRPEQPGRVAVARGSPRVQGPPLFISNCSFLI